MARLLRLAAAVVAIAAIAAVTLPLLWWQTQKSEQSVLLQDTYLYFDAASAVGLLIGAAVAALILLAQARILERLDDLHRRSGHDD